jgi:hypothetical protein
MKSESTRSLVVGGAVTLIAVLVLATPAIAQAPGGRGGPPGGGGESVDLKLKEAFEVPDSDARTDSIVASAEAFMATLTEAQRQSVEFEFTDNAQRANWSNLPEGIVQRRGIRFGDLASNQRAALNALLSVVLSESGLRNVELQMLADDTLRANGRGNPSFGSDYYFVSFLGEPSATAPWMLQFGGHHLAINATFFGADASFSPMLTGGQPVHVSVEGTEVVITERELEAARAFMDSLSVQQRSAVVRSDRAATLLLGPGAFGTVIAPEGIRAADLTQAQKTLLLDIVRARLGFINDNDAASIMARVEADIDQTWFGWWGPLDVQGAAYFRVTGPSILMEYAPQGGGRGGGGADPDHVHSMYRDPTNDYGRAWISVGP